MTIFTVLHDPVFWFYTVPVFALLMAAWGALFLFRSGPRFPEEIWRVFWTWVLYFIVVTVPMIFGKEIFALVVALVSLFACKEFARATGLYNDWVFTGLVYLAIVIVNLVALWPGYNYDAFMATPIYVVAGLCLVPVIRNRPEGMLQHVALSVMAFVYFGYFLAHLSLMCALTDVRATDGGLGGLGSAATAMADRPGSRALQLSTGCLFFILYGVATADLAGWLFSRRFKGHPLTPRVNPETTVERVIVTLLWAFLWSFTLGWTLPQPEFNWLAMLISAILFGVMAPLGELVMRYIYRDVGLDQKAKDSLYVPYLALGHLNRLLFVAPLFFRMVRLVELQRTGS